MSVLDDGVRNIRRFTFWPVRHDGERVLLFCKTVVAFIDPWVASEASSGDVMCMMQTLNEANYAHATGQWTPTP